MAAVTVHSNFGAQENEVCHCFHFAPFYLPWSEGTGCHDLNFLNVEFYASFFTLLFHLHQEALWFLFAFTISVVSSAYLMLFLLAILILACDSSNLAFYMIYSAYKLNNQSDNIQPCLTPFPILNQSVVPCPVLTISSWPAYTFLRKQVRWSGIPSLEEFFTVCCDPHSQRL